MNLKVTGGGDIKAYELVAQKANVKITGGSEANINVSEELEIEASGGGDVYYIGSPVIKSVHVSGGSELHRK